MALFVFCLLMAVCSCSTKKSVLEREIKARLAALHRAGYPTNLVELNQWYEEVPAEENAALLYLQAFAEPVVTATNLPVVGQAKLPPSTGHFSETMRQSIAEYLEKNKRTLQLLHQGASRSKAHYPVDFTQGWAVKLGHHNGLKRCVRMVCLEGVFNQDNGQIDTAVRCVVDGMKLAGSLQNEPLLISQLVRMAAQSIFINSLQHLLNNQRLTAGQLEELIRVFQAAEGQAGLTRTWAGERCLYLPFFSAPVAEQEKVIADMQLENLGSDPAAFLKNEYATDLIDIDFLFYLESFEACILASQKPYPQRLQAANVIDLRSDRARNLKLAMSLIVLPNVKSAFIEEANNLAALRLTLAVLAVEKYRVDQAANLPESLEALKPAVLRAVPEDPFDGKPLRYKTRTAGYMVYSVGEDGQDNGGSLRKAGATTNSSAGTDIVFVVER